MQRMQVSLTNAERSALDAEGARTGRPISALIRDAVDKAYGAELSLNDDLADMRGAFGTWRDCELDGETWVDQLSSGSRFREFDK